MLYIHTRRFVLLVPLYNQTINNTVAMIMHNVQSKMTGSLVKPTQLKIDYQPPNIKY